jgi:hypothetical protein
MRQIFVIYTESSVGDKSMRCHKKNDKDQKREINAREMTLLCENGF